MHSPDDKTHHFPKLDALFELLPFGAVFQNDQGEISAANPAAQRILGMTLDQMRGVTSVDPRWRAVRSDGTPLPGEQHPAMTALRTGEPVCDVVMGVFNPNSHQQTWIKVNAIPILTGELNDIRGVYTVFEDITERRCLENSLKESEERLQLAAFHNGIGIWDWNLQTMEMVWDDSMFELYQIRREDFSGAVDAWEKSLHPDDREHAERELEAALSGEGSFDTEFRVCWPNGEIHHIKAVAKIFRDEVGAPLRMLGTNIDITRQRAAANALKDSEEQLRFVLEGSQLGFWDWNIATGEVHRNERWATMLGYTYDEIKHTTQQWSDFVHPKDRERAWDSIWAALDGRSAKHKLEYRMLHKDGSIRWILDQANVMQRDANGKPIRMCGTHTDITTQKIQEEELIRRAHIDFLTQVCNRGYFMEQAALELSRVKRYESYLSLLMLDIDLFKDINDRYGHETGDRVLQHLANICRNAFREVDVIGRLGGEEFAILMPETSKAKATEVAERLRTTVAESKVSIGPGLPIVFTISIGVAAHNSKDDNIDVLLNSADKALYAAKNAGRNRVCVM